MRLLLVKSISFSADSKIVASTSCMDDYYRNWFERLSEPYDNFYSAVNLWDVQSGNLLGTKPSRHNIDSVSFSPTESLLIAGSGDSVGIMRLDGDLKLSSFVLLRTGDVVGSGKHMFSPDGQIIACVSNGRRGRGLSLWNLREKKLLWKETRDISWQAFLPDGQALANYNSDNVVEFRDIYTGTITRAFKGPEYASTGLFSPDGKLLITHGGIRGDVEIWDLTDGKLLRVLPGHGQSIYSLAISPDGKVLAVADGNQVKVWLMHW